MTMAVCLKCGSIKFGAFCPCGECGYIPVEIEDLAKHMMLTDHYFPLDTLKQIGAVIQGGEKVNFRNQDVEQVMASLKDLDKMQPGFTDGQRKLREQMEREKAETRANTNQAPS
jgi:hypothetical protein